MTPLSNDHVLVRYVVSVAFALVVFATGFYALVLYQFALPELIQGAFISMMTLAVQYVFGEQLASGATRRARQSFEAGSHAAEGSTGPAGPEGPEGPTGQTGQTGQTGATGARG